VDLFTRLRLQKTAASSPGGDNSAGQTNIPIGITNVVAIAAGSAHNVVLLGEGAGKLSSSVSLSEPVLHGGTFNAFSLIPTRRGRVYRIESTDSLLDPIWRRSRLVPGNGARYPLNDQGVTTSERYYRLRQW
jgi:hypothetical protein